MTLNVEVKNLLVEEIKFVAKKMEDSSNVAEKLFFFSAVYAVFQRVYNISYHDDLVYMYFILRSTYETFMQRFRAIQGGDTTVLLYDEQLERLEFLTRELGEKIESDSTVDDTLKGFVLLLHSTTGNGHYLRQKGLLQI